MRSLPPVGEGQYFSGTLVDSDLIVEVSTVNSTNKTAQETRC